MWRRVSPTGSYQRYEERNASNLRDFGDHLNASRRYNPEDHNQLFYRREKLKYHSYRQYIIWLVKSKFHGT
jgi:hypothetical protein